MPKSPRQRMIKSAMLLMRERGVDATSFTDVLERSGAPRGSIYHHFPRGKEQLVEEATRFAGEYIAGGMILALAEEDLGAALSRFTDWWRGVLAETKFAAGCPVVAVVVEGDKRPGAREAASAVFGQWVSLLSEAMMLRGVPEDRASDVASLCIAAIEGAVIMARADRSLEPLDRTSRELVAIMRGVSPASAQVSRNR